MTAIFKHTKDIFRSEEMRFKKKTTIDTKEKASQPKMEHKNLDVNIIPCKLLLHPEIVLLFQAI